MQRVLILLLCLAALLVGGCGGHPGSGSGGAPFVIIDWPARTRDFLGPMSALSVQFVLTPVSGSQPAITINGNRDTNILAHSETYTATTAGGNGIYNLTGTFYANAGQTGSVVGTVSSSVFIQLTGALSGSSGDPLGQVNFTTNIGSIEVTPGQAVRAGAQSQLMATVADVNGNPLVISPGSFTWTLFSSTTNIDLTPDGIATGLEIGQSQVTVATDNLTSAIGVVNVVPLTASIIPVNVNAVDIAFDLPLGEVYVTTASSSGTGTGQIIPVTVPIGALGTPISIGVAPDRVAISTDGSTLYVSSKNGIVYELSLPDGTLIQSFPLPTGTYAAQILPIPNETGSIAVSTVSKTDGKTDMGTLVFDGTTVRGPGVKIGQSIAMNDDGSQIFGYLQTAGSGQNFTVANVGGSGVSIVNQVQSGLTGTTDRIYYVNDTAFNGGEIADDNGMVLSQVTGASLGQLVLKTTKNNASPIPGMAEINYVGNSPYTVTTFGLSNNAQTATFALSAVTGTVSKSIYAGSTILAFITTGASPNQLYLVQGLSN